MTEADLTAYCGLYCGDCIRFGSRVFGLADELLEEFEKTQFSRNARVKQVEESRTVCAGPALMRNCLGYCSVKVPSNWLPSVRLIPLITMVAGGGVVPFL
jgi:hypothetical protein